MISCLWTLPSCFPLLQGQEEEHFNIPHSIIILVFMRNSWRLFRGLPSVLNGTDDGKQQCCRNCCWFPFATLHRFKTGTSSTAKCFDRPWRGAVQRRLPLTLAEPNWYVARQNTGEGSSQIRDTWREAVAGSLSYLSNYIYRDKTWNHLSDSVAPAWSPAVIFCVFVPPLQDKVTYYVMPGDEYVSE